MNTYFVPFKVIPMIKIEWHDPIDMFRSSATSLTRLRNARCWRLSDWLTNHDRSGKIYSGIYRDEKFMPREKDKKKCSRTKLRGALQASFCLKRSDCCLSPTPVYSLEDSRRFYELLSTVLLLLSLTVLQLVSL
ncbi:hypothetical protein LAZ67_14000696 [Cordylochernes scorpioides]|uniref:Uncharacterized protein n=1 Tax=Cordylochernes scorpioides TaxID=51811 RepID=A0ABY6L7R7_9ARAC|nr:hypothetical protein LAZ67_14000696 [Cordylochernes scorpioides]